MRLPLNRVGSLNKINNAFSELEQKHQREPTEEELAEVMEMTPDEIRTNLTFRARKVSMDAPFAQGDGDGTLLDIMEDESADIPDANLMMKSLQVEVKRALATLSERESQVISLYYGLSGGHAVTLEEIADQFDLTRERVRQIKEKATRKLRQSSRSKELKAYLG